MFNVVTSLCLVLSFSKHLISGVLLLIFELLNCGEQLPNSVHDKIGINSLMKLKRCIKINTEKFTF